MAASKPTRSQFVEKLHDLLENPYDAESLHWCSDDAFEISTNDAKARQALSAKWDFRSLSSFIRQLSYYGFRRLSDRRRSGERKANSTGFIVFSHPTGFFVRGDASPLPGIVRKVRNRPPKRRVSASSAASNEPSDESPPPMPQWASTEYQPACPNPLPSGIPTYAPPPVFTSSFGPLRTVGDQQALASASSSAPTVRPGTNVSWRAYTPPTWSFTGTTSTSPQQPIGRRTSVSDFKLSGPVSPRSGGKAELPSPRLRKAASSLSIQTHSSFGYHGHHQQQHQQHEDPLPSPTYRSTAYPTPTFTSYAPLPSGLAAPYDPPAPSAPPYAPYTHYSHAPAPMTYSTNPLPSPTYSSDGDHAHPTHHQQQQHHLAPQHLDPRSLLTAPNSGRSSFSGPAGGGGGATHYFSQRVPTPVHLDPASNHGGWSPAPRMGEGMYSSYGGGGQGR